MKQFHSFLFLCFMLSFATTISGQNLVISEFRVRGPSGANDEFIEIYNNSNSNHTVAGGGTGYAVVASDGVARFVIPNGTVIPARGHYLGVNSVAYSLASYPAGNGTTATGDATYTTDIPDNAGIALFNTSIGGNFILANRLDAVGSTSEANTLYKEGAGYPALTPFSINYCFHRRQMSGLPLDTDNNASDFKFEDTNGTSAGAGQSLGAPGPENLSSPVSFPGGLVVTRLDAAVTSAIPPNAVRDFTSDPANNSTFGTLDLRLKVTNTTGGSITRLRIRIVDVSTFPSPSGVADLRPRTSTSVVAVTSGGPVTVQGTTLEQPPSQPNGGGINSSMGISTITLGTPLANGATENFRLLFGIQQTGIIKADLLLEALPEGSGGNAGSGAGVSVPITFRGSTEGGITMNPSGVPAALGDVIISEFRVRGPSGANDEYVELYNKTNNNIIVTTTDGSMGWALAASNGITRFIIPIGTVIPAHGHYLGVNSLAYSLGSYPSGNGTTATGDVTYTSDIPDNAGIALFNTMTSANFSLATRMDAVGSTSEANTLYKEGAGYPALTPFSIDYTFYRKTDTGTPLDDNDNATDFKFEDTNGTSAGAGQSLGAPGPQNLTSPVRVGTSIVVTLADPTVAVDAAPNYVRVLTSDPANNSTFGTIALRYKIENVGGAPITRLRFRIDSINTFPSPSGIADLRPRTSSSAGITVTGVGAVTAEATTLEQPPSQPNGGGFNSSFSAGTVTLGTPLSPGQSVYVNMLFGIQQNGVFNILWAPEALPEAGSPIPIVVRGDTEPCPVITVNNPATTTGTAGAAFSQSFTSAGGVAPVTYTTASTLPTGLTLAPDGTLSGTPTQTGSFPIVVTATDANTCTGTSTSYPLQINCPTLTHTNVLATPAAICVGSSTVITGTVNGGVVNPPLVTTTSSGAINLPITDNSPAGVNSVINVPAAALSGASSLQVRLNIGHSWVGDLVFTLTSPCGNSTILDRPGWNGSGFGNSNNLGSNNANSPPSPPPAVYIFDVSAAGVISETALAPGFIPTGSYRPSNATGVAHNFNGVTFPCAAGGNWTLNISDNAGGDIGTLIDWAIITTSGGELYTHTLTGPGTITQNPSTGANNRNASFNVAALPLGNHVFTLTSTDPLGCSVATTPINVTVNPLPTVTCPPNMSVNSAAGQCGAVVNYPPATATGIPAPTITYSHPSGSFFPVGPTIVTVTATNACTSVNCQFTITVADVTPPVITCPADVTVTTSPGLCTGVATFGAPVVTDNCTQPVSNTSVTWSQTGQRGAFFDVTNNGAHPIVITSINPQMFSPTPLTDAFSVYFTTSATTYQGNQTTAGAWTLNSTANVTVPGNATAPAGVTIPLTTPLTLAPGQSKGVYVVGTQSFGGGPVAYLSTGGAPAYTGPQTYQNGALSFSGGVGSSGLFTGIFGTGAPGDIRLFYGSISYGPGYTQTGGLPSGSVFPIGTTVNTFTATDPSGNTASCSFNVIVNDGQAPTVTCPASVTRPTDAGVCTSTYTPPAPTHADNCGVTVRTWALTGATTGASAATGINTLGSTAFNIGVTTVTYTVRDAANNTGTCSFTVTVTDAVLPVITGPVNRTVCAGTTATFSVTAVTAPTTGGPLSYQWQQWNGTGWVNAPGASTGSSYSVAGVTQSMNTNTFRVNVTGLCTTVPSSAATLFVNPLPTISLTSTNAGVLLPGQTTSIVANVNPTGGTFAWFKNGAPRVPTVTGGTLSNLTVDDAGVYRATYTDLNGCVNTSADLVISAEVTDRFFLAPNPNFGQFWVRYYNQTGEALTVTVFDAKGRRVHQQQSATGLAYTRIDVDMGLQAGGIYVVELRGTGGRLLGRKQIIVGQRF